jgi:hypothetical protein
MSHFGTHYLFKLKKFQLIIPAATLKGSRYTRDMFRPQF